MPNAEDVIVTTTVTEIKRLRNTVYGNPVYRIITQNGSFKTYPNAGWVAGIVPESLIGKTVSLTLNSANTVVSISE